MVNWKDPTTQNQQLFIFGKVLLTLQGAYFYEFITSLNFDIQLFSEIKRSPAWTKWIYLTCRYFTLGYYILTCIGGFVTERVNCKALVKIGFFLSYSTISLASSLIGIRVAAIWDRNPKIIGIVVLCLFIQIALSLDNLSKISSEWDAESKMCQFVNVNSAVTNISAVFVSDVILLASMLVGLLRRRSVY